MRATYTNGTDVVREFYAYDHEGRVTAVTNALGNVTTTDYDARGNAVAVDGAAYPTRRSYDSENRLVSLRTTRDGGANWDETTWTYDDLTGLLLTKTYADGSQMTYTYHDANAKRIWKFNEMDADHVTPWSKGGATDIRNCQMLCRTHNRAKGNR